MSSIDLKSKIKVQNSVNGQTINSDTTTWGADVNIAGFNAVAGKIAVDAVTAGDATLTARVTNTAGSDYITIDDITFPTLDTANTNSLVNLSASIKAKGYKYFALGVTTANSANLYAKAELILGYAGTNPVA